MNKKMLEMVQSELCEFDESIIELSNELTALGFEDICEFENWEELLEEGNVIVAVQDDWESHIQIFFRVTIKNGVDESVEATNVRITHIQEF